MPEGTTSKNVQVTGFGQVNGYRESVVLADNSRKTVDCFLGIPFAQPPVENLRFRPPEPLPEPDDASKVAYNAMEPPASCYQTVDTAFESRLVDAWNPNTNMSEDCLYLNIWKPQAASAASKKAVMVSLSMFCSGRTLLDSILITVVTSVLISCYYN